MPRAPRAFQKFLHFPQSFPICSFGAVASGIQNNFNILPGFRHDTAARLTKKHRGNLCCENYPGRLCRPARKDSGAQIPRRVRLGPVARTNRLFGVADIPWPPTYSVPIDPEGLRQAVFPELSSVSSSFSFELEFHSPGLLPCVLDIRVSESRRSITRLGYASGRSRRT